MRTCLILIAILFSLSSSAQIGQIKVFKTTKYVNGNLFRKTTDTVNLLNEHTDVYFFKRQFSLPYYLPEKFVDSRYQNQKVSMWRNPNGKKDHQQNWENTYTYDSLGRVINYDYSGCFACSNFPYNYIVTYNSSGQVERIFNTINSKEDFRFYYNNNSDIVKLEKYLLGKLETEIVVVD